MDKEFPYLCSVHPSKLDHLMVLPLIRPGKLVSFYSILFLNPMTPFKILRWQKSNPGPLSDSVDYILYDGVQSQLSFSQPTKRCLKSDKQNS